MAEDGRAAMPKTIAYGDRVGDSGDNPDKLVAPAAERNLDPILAMLRDVLGEGPEGRALELASGTGQQVAAFATAFPDLDWQPSDIAGDALTSIAAWAADTGRANLSEPLRLDLLETDWHLPLDTGYRLMLAINLVHIAPWRVTEGLMAGATRLLAEDGVLIVYGPFLRDGDFVSDGNCFFDYQLRASDSDWGLRDTVDMAALAGAAGLEMAPMIEMPANNTTLIFRKPAG